MTAPERYRTLAEVCELYFPGVSTCVLRWMIKRHGYAHSRWGREYRLTDSQVAAIQADLARPAEPGSGGYRCDQHNSRGRVPRTNKWANICGRRRDISRISSPDGRLV
jgi:hypothetical protein